MTPNTKYPEEIDVFCVPHSRMKELVNTYTQRVRCVDFRDCQQVWKLLDELNHTFYEFKSHESIENMFIMDQLRNRLKQRHIYNSAVCNCHSDNRITEMMKLVRSGKYLLKNGVGKRLRFGHKLQKRFSNFVKEFLPHMEEEENIFQPLLMEHFEYDELKIIKELVVEQHELLKDPQYCEKAAKEDYETDEAIKDCRDIDESMWCLSNLFNIPEDKIIEGEQQTPANCSPVESYPDWLSLPPEVAMKIFEHLEPPDRGRSAQVCSLWSKYAYSSSIWKEIYPIQWSRGIWKWKDAHLNWEMEDKAAISNTPKWDEDADIDETENAPTKESISDINIFNNIITYLLPRIGKGVKSLVMDGGCNIPSRMIKEALVQCPNLVKLSAAYCNIDYYSFKGLCQKYCMAKLKYLDLQGCTGVDDKVLYSLLDCMNMKKFQSIKQKTKVQCVVNNRALVVCPFMADSSSHCLCRLQHTSLSPPFCPLGKKKGLIAYNNDGSCNVSNGRTNRNKIHLVPEYSTLTHLNLSGCYRIKGISLIGMADDGFLGRLSTLNLSGCFQIPSNYLRLVIQFCHKLNPIQFTYCDDISGGPFDSEANGCDSVDHPLKVCCKSIRLN